MTQTTLANAELAVMNQLWEHGSLTARQLREHLYPDERKAQHGTVQRLLQRLEEKGFVSRDRSLAVHFFSATLSKDVYAAQQLETLADKLTAGSIAPLITHLVESQKISSDEIERIRQILDAHDATHDATDDATDDAAPNQGPARKDSPAKSRRRRGKR